MIHYHYDPLTGEDVQKYIPYGDCANPDCSIRHGAYLTTCDAIGLEYIGGRQALSRFPCPHGDY